MNILAYDGCDIDNCCVYTCLFGDYERLNEQYIANKTKTPFICFTDNPELKSKTWKIVHITPLFNSDSVRSQRAVKLQPHKYLKEFEFSLYIDNSVILKKSPKEILQRYKTPSGFGIFNNIYRKTLLDVFKSVTCNRLDDKRKILEQLSYYYNFCPEIFLSTPLWGGVMLREHKNSEVIKMLDMWLSHVLRYSRRDQLSINFAFEMAYLKPNVYKVDLQDSWFHSWPHTLERKNNIRIYEDNSNCLLTETILNELLNKIGNEIK